MAAIYFHIENGNLTIKNKVHIRKAIIETSASYNRKVGQLNYIFGDDIILDQINRQYLNHTDLTDIITFDTAEDDRVSGDIFISVERVKENSMLYNNSFNQEMLRVIFHGLLHLLGFNDKTENEVRIMRSMEDALIQKYTNNVTRETFYV